MDARAMQEHDWDECGCEIARLYEADSCKYEAIRDAWWELAEDDQEAVHGVMCEDKRDPADLEIAREFEKHAAELEDRYRDRRDKGLAKLAQEAQAAGRQGEEDARRRAMESLRSAVRQVDAKLNMGGMLRSDRFDGNAW